MRNKEEEQHCIAFMDWVQLAQNMFPELKLLYHIPNGGARPAHYRFNNKTKKPERISVEGAKLKRMGVRAGVWDYHLPVARPWQGNWKHALWIEFKSTDGDLKQEQHDWAIAMEQQGHLLFVVKDWTHAKDLVLAYLGVKEVEPCGRA